MAGAKRFLIFYVLGYLIVATTLNLTLGPPGMSKGYLAEFKSDHNRYIEAIKNKEYKIYVQRPELYDLGAEEYAGLNDRAAFVEEYVVRPKYIAEEARRGRYELIFDFFNTAMVILLVGRFARKPFAGLIDGMIEAIRLKLKEAESAKNESAKRLEEAQGKINALPQDQAGYEELTKERIEIIRRDSALFTGQSVSILNKETEDRKRFEITKAKHEMKEKMVDTAINQVIESINASDSSSTDDHLIDQFIADIQKRSS